MDNRFVVDTTSLISYFSGVFGESSQISQHALNLIDRAFYEDSILLIFPSIVFVEIFKKWFVSEAKAAQIRFEVLERIKNRGNMEIKPLEREVLENFIKIQDIEPKYNFDNHDKQILASAMMLQCPLITSDLRLIRYNKRKKVIPKIIS